MNIKEPYRLHFKRNRQERYYGQMLSWSYERPNPFGSLMVQDVYAINAKSSSNAPYEIMESRRYAKPFAAEGFENVAGKGKLCRQAGLTGAEKKACKQNIKNKCGKKPRGFFGIKGSRKRELQEKWSKCAQEMVVTPEEAAQDVAEKIVPEGIEGLSTGAKVMLGVAVVGTLTLIGFAVAAKMKKKPAPMQAPMARPMAR